MAALVIFYLSCAAPVSQNAPPVGEEGVPSPTLPPFTGKKLTIAVIGLRNETESPDPVFRELRVGFGLSNMLATALFETGRFTLVERNQEVLERIIKEQWLGQTGYINSQTAAETGKMIGAQAVVYGQVTEFGIRKVGVYTGVYGQRNITTRIVIDVKMVNTETGEIIGAASGEGSVTTSTAGVAFVWEEGVEQFDQTTVGKASRQAIYKIARQLALQYESKL